MGRILVSKSHDPAYNLALEEHLIKEGINSLYLWQNDNTIVIGRNQNPYKECNIEQINKDGVRLVRRKSGGGAVFHDLGNLNFTLISSLAENNVEKNFELVNRALNNMGIASVFNGRNDLVVDGKKISGNAFYEKGDIFCHHGTLLVDVDMGKLSLYLKPSKLKLESKGIDSVKSRVLNLKDLKANISIDAIKSSLIDSYSKEMNVKDLVYIGEDDLKDQDEIMDMVEVYRSWEWVYGQSPKYNLEIEEKFSWGIIEFNLYIENGLIEEAEVYTDSIVNDNFKGLAKGLRGAKFTSNELERVIEKSIGSRTIKEDLLGVVKSL